eukprot:TRINITY_DN18589_c0_g1::TRINITY_DN18589_c0_g1_i1::g.1115::m.1115 TRINITY_DN18589_c0_g1::TRINITY_DN18589_c0_g1_i1::g.1115  ORF type:complete len:1073 (-),score=240.85,sp/Q9FPT1/UBP12_ARATH/37.32/0.0,UCH/PF00443.24/2.1e-55,USP7_C2/PF14533.1/50,USP7_C2/PF14533.1/61,USP7_C2/PF14533.1/4.6e-32,USP7_ICP0_bdg/PF12436.3/0.15,USP7_ICP0_bdg/PF12436.3/1.5e-25,USP7_ICP0_bdg/PF12436.3/1.7e+02,USP7_ICP0_bdg/PF12436.3/2.5e+03,UCH_1/PF13423.1/2.5e-27,UCH_1/PF13423.1/6.5e+03,MATH/PF00917.21/9.1e-12,MATH/PF00917.21
MAPEKQELIEDPGLDPKSPDFHDPPRPQGTLVIDGEKSGEYTFEFYVDDMRTDKVHSDVFRIGDFNWRLLIFPRGNPTNQAQGLSVYLEAADADRLPPGWRKPATFSLVLVSQKSPELNVVKDCLHNFDARDNDWGFGSLVTLQEFRDKEKAFIVNGKAIIKASVKVHGPYAENVDGRFMDPREDTGFVGLRNQGATCYMNSLLQTLYLLAEFRKSLYKMPTESDDTHKSIPLALQRLFYHLQNDECAPGTKELTKSFGWDSVDAFTQHDVQELLRVLSDNIENKMKGTEVDGAINHMFEGEYQDVIECLNVDYKSTKKAVFQDLSLDVKGCKTLIDSFKKFCEQEFLTGNNKYRTDDHGLQDAKKGFTFLRFPPVLLLHLKRFDYDFQYGRQIKINDRHEFPTEMNLNEFLASEADHDVPYDYVLHSVLIHSGDVHGGHYYAFIRPEGDDKWYRFDDERVFKVSEKEAVSDNYGYLDDPKDYTRNFKKYSNAYMLVYVRKELMESYFGRPQASDIPTSLKKRLDDEQERNDLRRKEKDEAHLYYNIQVYLPEHLPAKGPGLFGPEKASPTLSLRIKRTVLFSDFIAEVSSKLNVDPNQLRLWFGVQRRSFEPFTLDQDAPLEKTRFFEQLPFNAEADFLAEIISDVKRRSPSEGILYLVKTYEPETKTLQIRNSLFAPLNATYVALLPTLLTLLGYPPNTPLLLFHEDGHFVSPVPKFTDLVQGNHGDVLVVQKAPQSIPNSMMYPLAQNYYEYLTQRIMVTFRSTMPKRDVNDIEVEMLKTYDHEKVLQELAKKIQCNEPHKIKLIPAKDYNDNPKEQAWDYLDREKTLGEYVCYRKAPTGSPQFMMFYEIMPFSYEDLEKNSQVQLIWLEETYKKGKELLYLVPKEEKFAFVYQKLKKEADLKIPEDTEIRIFTIINQYELSVYGPEEPVSNLTTPLSVVYAQRVPKDEAMPLPDNTMRVTCVHTQSVNSNSVFGVPFSVVIAKGATLKEVKESIRSKLDISEEEVNKWKFAVGVRDTLYSPSPAGLLEDTCDVCSAFKEANQVLLLEHVDPDSRKHTRYSEKAVKIYN